MKNKININRRNVLKTAGLAPLAASFPGTSLFAKSAKSKFQLIDLEQQIITRAKELSANKHVTLSILQPKGSLGNVKPVGDLFQKFTGVSINYIEASLDEINAKILAQSITNKTSFDIALPATFGLPDLIEADSIRDLDEFVEKYEPENFDQGMLFPIGDSYKGKFYGYQTDGDTYLMFYNKTWLDDEQEKKKFKAKYGYDLDIPKTWDQLDQMLMFFHRPNENKYGGALFRNKDYIAWEWWTRFHANGHFPFDEKLNPQINSQAGIDALEHLIGCTEFLYPQAKSNGLFENWEAFSQGNIFCNIGWGGTQKYLNSESSNIRDNLAFGPTPGGYINGKLINTPYFNWGWNYTVSSKSKEPELAYLFTLYACSPVLSTLAVQYPSGYFDPFRREHYHDKKIQATYSKSFLDAHQFSMENSIPDLYLSGQGEYWDVLKENLDLADRGKLSAKEALDITAKLWNKISHEYGRQNQLEQWMFLRSKYPDSLKKMLI